MVEAEYRDKVKVKGDIQRLNHACVKAQDFDN